MGPWQIFLLDSAVNQIHTVMVTGMTLMDLDELRELEAQRLERLHALRMFTITGSKEWWRGPREVCAKGGATMQRPRRHR